MRKSKVSFLCGGKNKDFIFDEVHTLAAWIITTFSDLKRIEIYQVGTDFEWTLVLISDEVDLRSVFVENFRRSPADTLDAQKRFASIECFGSCRSPVIASANSPFVDVLVFPSNWRSQILLLNEEYSTDDSFLSTKNYFEKIAMLQPVKVL
jgi:hypothetical protein